MEPILQDRGIYLTRVQRRRTLCQDHFELTLSTPHFPPAGPGQFIQVLCRPPEADESVAPAAAFLRRPFSIAGLRRSAAAVEIRLIGHTIGPGTGWLDARRPGDFVNILGPFGNAFSLPRAGERALLIAGGVGLPPIRWLGETLRRNKVICESIYGVQSRSLLPVSLCKEPSPAGEMTLCVEEFAREGIPTCITTDDGSCGLRGLVTEALGRHLTAVNDPARLRVFTCGPEPMLKAVAEMCMGRGVACEAALERVMGCGMATCQSCVVPVVDPTRAEGLRYALCCRDGPVFDASRVIW